MKGRLLLLGVLFRHAGITNGTAAPNAVRRAPATICPQIGSLRVSLRSTDRLPEASGTVQVERKGGTTDVDVKVDWMKPASLFGGDYNTYVVWVVPPRGPAASLAVLVAAEPHFLISTSSPVQTAGICCAGAPAHEADVGCAAPCP
jgi:hypothetical protein